VTIHGLLTGRDEPDQHPIGAITGLSGELEALNVNESEAATILDADKVGFFSILGNVLRHITWANIIATLTTAFDLIFVRKKLVFYPTIQAATFNVIADMANKFAVVDYPTTITATILELGILEGDVITYHQKGAGEIEFVVETALNQEIWHSVNKSSTDSRTVQLTRMPDNAGVQQYLLIGGVE